MILVEAGFRLQVVNLSKIQTTSLVALQDPRWLADGTPPALTATWGWFCDKYMTWGISRHHPSTSGFLVTSHEHH